MPKDWPELLRGVDQADAPGDLRERIQQRRDSQRPPVRSSGPRFRPVAAWLLAGVGVAVVLVVLAIAAHSHQRSTPAQPTSTACVWQHAQTPNPKLGHESQLVAVSAPTPTSAWAVGNFFSGHEGGVHGPIIERWDGTHWQLTDPGLPTGVFLSGVSALSPGDVWIAGSYRQGNHAFVQHLHDGGWQTEQLPVSARYSHLTAIHAINDQDVWAVGDQSDGHTGHTLIVHWDGSRWTVVPSPNGRRSDRPGHAYSGLQSINGTSPDDMSAVGATTQVAPDGQATTLILHWDGHTWSRVPSPNADPTANTSSMLFSVSAATSTNAWAVGSWNTRPGYGGGGDHTLTEHWNGTRWQVTLPLDIAGRSILYGVLANSDRVITVGDHSLPYQTLTELRANGTWQTRPSFPGSLADIAKAPDGRLWAVGQRGDGTLAVTCR
jgi:hypothetical protein